MADLNKAIRLAPKDAFAFNNRGLVYVKKGEISRAIADFNEAIRLKSDYVTAIQNRGRAYLASGDAKRAAVDAEKAKNVIK